MIHWDIFLAMASPPWLSPAAALENSVAYAEGAEDLGYDGVWILEHHFTRFGVCPSALEVAGFLLGRTKRIRVGSAICVVPIDHPVRLAEKVALLDQLSGGRFAFGIGRGSFVKDFQVFKSDMSQNHKVMSEWTDIMLEAWRTGKCSGRGEFLRFDEVEIFPAPYTLPHPPIYVAAASPSTVEWAAKRGFPMLLEHALEDERKVSQLELYAQVAAEAGHDPDNIDHALSLLTPATDEPGRLEQVKRNLAWWVDEFHRASKLFEPSAKAALPNYELWHRRHEEAVLNREWTTEHRVQNFLRINPIGRTEECIERLQRTVEVTGINRVICGFEVLGERALVLEAMARCRKEGIPHIRPAKHAGEARARM